ncbi:unnamed protein product, partial [marine sediment metagenome]
MKSIKAIRVGIGKTFIIVGLGVGIILTPALPSFAADWSGTDWRYRQKITISSSMADSNQSNFPALIKLTDQSNPLFGNAQSDGDDIVFTSSDGKTKLSHEIEKYTASGTKELDCWVKLPALSSRSDTIIYMYYGNAAVSNQEDAANVWSGNYKAVWHMTGIDAVDSTSNNNHGTAYGDTIPTSSGIDGAVQFDG